jgi:hypothetical protein
MAEDDMLVPTSLTGSLAGSLAGSQHKEVPKFVTL